MNIDEIFNADTQTKLKFIQEATGLDKKDIDKLDDILRTGDKFTQQLADLVIELAVRTKALEDKLYD